MTNKVRLLVFTLLAVLLFAAFGCSGEGEAPEARRDEAAEDVASIEPAPEGGDVGPREGLYPPPFTLPDLDGNQVSLSDFEGKVVVLDLWATWCGPCKVEIPYLVQLYEEFKDDGLVVVGVGLDQGGDSILRPFVEKENVTYTVLVGNRSVSQAYNVTGIPTTFMIGRDGRIYARHVGFAPQMAEQLRADIVSLLERNEEGA